MKVCEREGKWWRILPVLLTPVLLWLVLRGVSFSALGSTFRHMNGAAFTGAVVLYGLLFVPAAWRWHLILRLGGQAKAFGATWRASLIGHFFYTILFGVVGGDSAKAVFYARWQRFRPEKILATAPLDRLLGFGGSLLFALSALLIAVLGGAFDRGSDFGIKVSTGWIAAIAAAALIVWIVVRCAGRHRLWNGFVCAFRSSGKALLASRSTVLKGLSSGLLVQVALSGVLALNLCAVSAAAIPWQKLLWTFPVIIALSALPVTFGGLGTREGAATLLWAIYGVPKADAVAAALLTMAVGLLWAAIAGCLLLVTMISHRSAVQDSAGLQPAITPISNGQDAGKKGRKGGQAAGWKPGDAARWGLRYGSPDIS